MLCRLVEKQGIAHRPGLRAGQSLAHETFYGFSALAEETVVAIGVFDLFRIGIGPMRDTAADLHKETSRDGPAVNVIEC